MYETYSEGQLLESSKYDFKKAYLRVHIVNHTDETL